MKCFRLTTSSKTVIKRNLHVTLLLPRGDLNFTAQYFNTLAAAVNEPALYRLLTFQVPKFMSLFRCTKVSLEVRGFIYEYFVTKYVLQGGVVSTSPNPLAGGQPIVGCPRLIFQYIPNYPTYQRPFLHPQTEDAPCRGDRDPLTTHTHMYMYKYNQQCKCNLKFLKIFYSISISPAYHTSYLKIRLKQRTHNSFSLPALTMIDALSCCMRFCSSTRLPLWRCCHSNILTHVCCA